MRKRTALLRSTGFHFVLIFSASEVSSPNDTKTQNFMSGRSYASSIEDCELVLSSLDAGNDIVATASDDEYLADSWSATNDDFTQCDNSLTGYEFVNGNGKKSSVRGAEPRKRGRPLKYERHVEVVNEVLDSSDDTSSRGTLDSIIPPLKDFSGSNNPFLIDNSSSSSASSRSSMLNFANSIKKIDSKMRIVRTVKRHLSAKDIVIGPNMEVKRRKLSKKRRGLVELVRTTMYLPVKSEPRDMSSSQSARNNPRLNAGGPECVQIPLPLPLDKSNDVPSTSSIKDQSQKPMTDLKSPLNWYFGSVADRVKNGERFSVQGKRILANGRLQYLIDWEGVL